MTKLLPTGQTQPAACFCTSFFFFCPPPGGGGGEVPCLKPCRPAAGTHSDCPGAHRALRAWPSGKPRSWDSPEELRVMPGLTCNRRAVRHARGGCRSSGRLSAAPRPGKDKAAQPWSTGRRKREGRPRPVPPAAPPTAPLH